MTELVVDPARLKAAGVTLRDQVLPVPPPPMPMTGGDSVSAALNVTLPIIESPVVDGLPDVQAALANTGSKIVTAAEMYTDTDKLLGEHVGAVQFLAAGERQAKDVVADQPVGAKTDRTLGAADDKADDKKDGDKKPTPKPAPKPSPVDFSQMSQAMQPASQGLQSIMSSMQQSAGSMGNAGAAPAKLADDTTKDGDKKADDAPPDETQLVDATTKNTDGAASGKQASGSAPVQPPTGGRPATTQPEAQL
jgi:hypothetical protein